MIGATSVIGEPLLPKLMKGFSQAHEEIEYDITIAEKSYLLKLLKEGDLDILIIDEEHITDSNLEVLTIEKMPYVLVSKKEYHSMESVSKDPLLLVKLFLITMKLLLLLKINTEYLLTQKYQF